MQGRHGADGTATSGRLRANRETKGSPMFLTMLSRRYSAKSLYSGRHCHSKPHT